MARAMLHPYYAYMVICSQCDGTQHEVKHPDHRLLGDYCERCHYPMLSCKTCACFVTCCSCGASHGFECEWPL